MANDFYYFDESDTNRIVSGIKKIERVNATNQTRGTGLNRDGSFWAKITGRASEKYSWEQIIFKDADQIQTDADVLLKGLATEENFAFEKNRSIDIPKNSIVRMYPTYTANSYVFEFSGGIIIKSVGAIDAMVDETPSSNTAKVYQMNDDDVLEHVDTINVYNMAGDFGPNKFGQAKFIMGKFYLDVETC